MKRSGQWALAVGTAGLVLTGALAAPRTHQDPPVSLAQPVAQVTSLRLHEFTVTGAKVYGGYRTRGIVTFSKPVPSGGVKVKVSGTGLKVPAWVKVKGGSRTGTFWIGTASVRKPVTRTVKVTYGKKVLKRRVTVVPLPVLQALTVSAKTLGAGGSAVGTVKLSAVAQPGGSVVRLAGSSPSVRVPRSVRVETGHRTASFRIKVGSGTAPQTVKLTARRGKAVKTAVFKVVAVPQPGHPSPTPTHDHSSPAQPSEHPSPAPTSSHQTPAPTPTPTPTSSDPVDAAQVSGLIVTPVRIKAGQSGTGTVTLDRPAPAGGTAVTLVQFIEGADVYVKFPGSVLVPAGQSSADFTITATAPEKDAIQVPVAIRASAGGTTAEVGFNVVPPLRLLELRMPAHAFGGNSVNGLAQLNASVDTDTYVEVTLVTGIGYWVPSQILIPAGRGYGHFSIGAGDFGVPGGVTVDTPLELRATLGQDTITSRTIVHPGLVSLTADGPVKAGEEVSFTAKLAGPAYTDISIFLDSRSPTTNLIQFVGSPVIPAGQNTAVFKGRMAEGLPPQSVLLNFQVAGTERGVNVTVTK